MDFFCLQHCLRRRFANRRSTRRCIWAQASISLRTDDFYAWVNSLCYFTNCNLYGYRESHSGCWRSNPHACFFGTRITRVRSREKISSNRHLGRSRRNICGERSNGWWFFGRHIRMALSFLSERAVLFIGIRRWLEIVA